MDRLILDKIDLSILATLARDCRISYRSVGWVKSMIQRGIIEKFIVRVNPSGFGYKTVHILVKTDNEITKDDVVERVKQFGDLAYHVHHMGKTSMTALIIKKSSDSNIIKSLNDSLKPATVSSIVVSELPVSTNLSETDLRIIRCLLLSGAKMEIFEIAKELDISEKTTTRRLDRMKQGRLLEFSIQCDPAAMVRYIQFAILISVEKWHYRDVYDHIYREFQESILYRPTITDPDDRLVFILFAENVFRIDFILAKVDSIEGVKNADVYILTKLQYHNDWIMREINERLLSQRLLTMN